MTVLVTGAAGFIGSALVRALRRTLPDEPVVSVDLLTYAADLDNLAAFDDDPGHTFVRADVADEDAVAAVLAAHRPRAVIHLAAETHVDRSLLGPLDFVHSNVLGTAVLLQQLRAHWGDRDDVRFLHVSTDEVFGSLGDVGRFELSSPYDPHSPYAASKAGADHLVRAWHDSFGLPTLVTHCGNNYGPRQFAEKLIPLVIGRAVAGESVPVYGRGDNVRDWIHVDDHCAALLRVLEAGEPGSTWLVGAGAERRNIDLVHSLLDHVDAELGRPPGTSRELVRFVTDRPGHDRRYALDSSELRERLGWRPRVDFDQGLRDTVRWYLAHLERFERADDDFAQRWYAPRGRA